MQGKSITISKYRRNEGEGTPFRIRQARCDDHNKDMPWWNLLSISFQLQPVLPRRLDFCRTCDRCHSYCTKPCWEPLPDLIPPTPLTHKAQNSAWESIPFSLLPASPDPAKRIITRQGKGRKEKGKKKEACFSQSNVTPLCRPQLSLRVGKE